MRETNKGKVCVCAGAGETEQSGNVYSCDILPTLSWMPLMVCSAHALWIRRHTQMSILAMEQHNLHNLYTHTAQPAIHVRVSTTLDKSKPSAPGGNPPITACLVAAPIVELTRPRAVNYSIAPTAVDPTTRNCAVAS